MKLLLAAFLLFPAVLAAQLPAPTQLRIIKGHLYDLSDAEAAGPNGAFSNYWISGQVATVYPKCVVIRSVEKTIIALDPNRVQFALRSGNNETYLQINGLTKLMANRPDGLDAGLWITLSPFEQSLFTKQTRYRRSIVFNYETKAKLKPGETIYVCGVSVGNTSLANTDAVNLPAFDCGAVFSGPITTNGWYKATPKGFVLLNNSKPVPLVGK